MPASDFRPPERRQFRPWQRYLSYLPLYLLVVPLSWTFEVTGGWKRLVRGARSRIRRVRRLSREGRRRVCVRGLQERPPRGCCRSRRRSRTAAAAEFADIHHVVPWPRLPADATRLTWCRSTTRRHSPARPRAGA